MRQNKPPHRGRNVFLSILLILLLALGALAFTFREELRLLYFAWTTPTDAVESGQADNDKRTQELLEQLAAETMRDLTEEERQLLASGLLSPEEAMALIRGETKPVTTVEITVPIETTASAETTLPSETQKPAETIGEPPVTEAPVPVTSAAQPPIETTVVTTVEKPIVTAAVTVTTTKAPADDQTALLDRQNEIIAKIYLLRATYLNEIDALIRETKEAYANLPPEQHNLAGKMLAVEQMSPKGNALEDKCDAEMDALLTELEGVLKQLGASTAILAEIKDTYAEQKMLKKAELYNEYLPKMN